MIVAVDVGGTKTLVVGYEAENETPIDVFETKFPTPANIAEFKTKLGNLLTENAETVTILSFAMPGIVQDGKVIRFAHVGWGEVDIVHEFSDFADTVIVNNDAALGAVSVARDSASKFSRVLYVTLSTGIGTGFIIDKNMETLLPSEGGHMMIRSETGKPVTWEEQAAGSSLYEKYGEYAEDMTDEENWKAYAYDVALGLVQLTAVLLPDVIVLGGPVGGQLPKYEKFLIDHMESISSWYIPVPKIIKAAHPSRAVARGCFYAAKQA